MSTNNEEEIKKKIIEYRDRGVCDSEGRTIAKEKRGFGKGDRHRIQKGTFRKYQEGFDRIK